MVENKFSLRIVYYFDCCKLLLLIQKCVQETLSLKMLIHIDAHKDSDIKNTFFLTIRVNVQFRKFHDIVYFY